MRTNRKSTVVTKNGLKTLLRIYRKPNNKALALLKTATSNYKKSLECKN